MENEFVYSFEKYLRSDKLGIITVFYNALDFPDKYVARLFYLDKPTKYAVVRNTLGEIRDIIPPQMTWMPRYPEDEPSVVESYV